MRIHQYARLYALSAAASTYLRTTERKTDWLDTANTVSANKSQHRTSIALHSAHLADHYGIRESYTVLAHLRWAIKSENATVTAEWLEMLGQELKPLKQAEADGGLLPQVYCIACRRTCH